jgi:hypothetical protein
VSLVEWVGVVSLLYLLACALQYRYINNSSILVQYMAKAPSRAPTCTLWVNSIRCYHRVTHTV